MKNSHALILALAALVVGVLAGAGFASEFWSARFARSALAHTEIGLMKNLQVLKEFQAGHVGLAKEKLEQQLDSDILTLDALKKDHKKLEKETFSFLPDVAEYRASVTYTPQEGKVSTILRTAREQHLTTGCTRSREQQMTPDCTSRAGEPKR